ncbi:MAG: YihY family inner membrane protein [Gammaproteobacteria bacterium]|nr:YihY family inner membrane protein [Gammaproteobacteria bacterium]
MRATIRTAFTALKRLPRRFVRDRCPRIASALSFTTVLAMVPLLIVVFSMLSTFPVFEGWFHRLEEFVYGNFVPAAGETIQASVSGFVAQAGKLTVFGLVFIAATAIALLATIEDAFNDIWRVRRGRAVMQRIVVYWAVITLGPLLIGASLSITSYVMSLPLVDGQPVLSRARSLVLAILPFVFGFCAFLLLYLAVPNKSVRFRDALVGAVLASFVFELIKRGFAYYILTFSNYEAIYGALAAVPIFLIWVYLSWLIILIGAELAAACGEMGSAEVAEPGNVPDGK